MKKAIATIIIILLVFSLVGYADSLIDKYVGVESDRETETITS